MEDKNGWPGTRQTNLPTNIFFMKTKNAYRENTGINWVILPRKTACADSIFVCHYFMPPGHTNHLKTMTMNLIHIPSDNGSHIVALQEIIRIESLNNYSKIFLSNKKALVVSKVLLWFEKSLPSHQFCRVHRSHLVNEFHIGGISKNGRSLILTNGEYISISRRKLSASKIFLSKQHADKPTVSIA
jgi:DNA-binding LytR/AlgR family response regulator